MIDAEYFAGMTMQGIIPLHFCFPATVISWNKSTNEAVDFLLLHINDKAEMSMKEFGELLDGIKYVNKESGEFEISFTDGTRLGGFGNSNKIDWNE